MGEWAGAGGGGERCRDPEGGRGLTGAWRSAEKGRGDHGPARLQRPVDSDPVASTAAPGTVAPQRPGGWGGWEGRRGHRLPYAGGARGEGRASIRARTRDFRGRLGAGGGGGGRGPVAGVGEGGRTGDAGGGGMKAPMAWADRRVRAPAAGPGDRGRAAVGPLLRGAGRAGLAGAGRPGGAPGPGAGRVRLLAAVPRRRRRAAGGPGRVRVRAGVAVRQAARLRGLSQAARLHGLPGRPARGPGPGEFPGTGVVWGRQPSLLEMAGRGRPPSLVMPVPLRSSRIEDAPTLTWVRRRE